MDDFVLTLYKRNSKRRKQILLVPFVVFEFELVVVRWIVLGPLRSEASTSTTVPTVLARRRKTHAHLVLMTLIVIRLVDNPVFSSLLLNFGMMKLEFAYESLK